MENEIKVNEYIRTKRGIIDKAVKILDDYIFLKSKFFITEYGESSTFIKKTDIVKHSPNLMDLIQCGDYVNGHKVVNEVWGEDDNNLYFEIEGGFNKAKYIGENDIKEVVTKEMMEAITYKVEE